MTEKALLIDTSRCIGCRGCQVACKQWNQLGVEVTTQAGTHQNPPDLSSTCYKLVRFNDFEDREGVKWHFFPDQCRHCIVPPCKDVADALGKEKTITIDPATGAVLFARDVKVSPQEFADIRDACPFNIPRYDPTTQVMSKCTMCIDRIANGLVPACVKACPTGAMSFGDWEAMVQKGLKRQHELKARFPKAQVLNSEDVRVLFLVVDEPETYHHFAMGREERGMTRSVAMKKLVRPFTGWLST